MSVQHPSQPVTQHPPLHELRVHHTSDATAGADTYYFTYRFSGAADYSVSHTLRGKERDAVLRALANTATNLDAFVVAANVSGADAKQAIGDFSFQQLSAALTDYCVPPELIHDVFAASTEPLMITTDDPGFPWHLIRVHGSMLGLYRPLGVRAIIPHRDGARPAADPRPVGPRRALLIADPTGDREYTRQEVAKIAQLLLQCDPTIQITKLAEGDARLENVLTYLCQRFDLIHYAGHATFDFAHGGNRGLVLWNKQLLPINDIHHENHGNTAVFLNACWGGALTMTVSPDSRQIVVPGGRPEGFGVEFAQGGARTFLAPLWPVFDRYASDFATRVYSALALGIPFGEALLQVRRQVFHERPWDPTWAVYLLYGHPLECLFPDLAPASAASPADHEHLADPGQRNPQSGAPANAPLDNPRDPGALRSPRSTPPPPLPPEIIEKLERAFIGDHPLRFATDALAAFAAALHTLQTQQRRGLHAADLLLAAISQALNADPTSADALQDLGDSPIVRELVGAPNSFLDAATSNPAASAHAGQLALSVAVLLLYADERGSAEGHGVAYNDALDESVQEAERLAQETNRSLVTALDLVEGLLTAPHGSLKLALSMLLLDPAPIRARLRAARLARPAAPGSPPNAPNDGGGQPIPTPFDMGEAPTPSPAAPAGASPITPPNAPSPAPMSTPAATPVSTPHSTPLPVASVVSSGAVNLLEEARRGRLRYVYGWTERRNHQPVPAPRSPVALVDPRLSLLTDLVTALTSAPFPHVLVRGRSGVGLWALVEALAIALVSCSEQPPFSALASAQVFAIQPEKSYLPGDSPAVRLATFLSQRIAPTPPTILAVRKLPAFLATASQDERAALLSALDTALATPGAHLILTAPDGDMIDPGLAQRLMRCIPIVVPPADAELAAHLIAGHLPWLTRHIHVPINNDALKVAAAQQSPSLAQPGLGVRILSDALASRAPITDTDPNQTVISLTGIPTQPVNASYAQLTEHEVREAAKRYRS